jgi:hypothetical protein
MKRRPRSEMRTPAKGRSARSGLTAVELAIAVAVIAVIITATLLFVRQRRAEQHGQLQAAADANPAQVFDIALRSEPDRIVAGKPFAFILEIHNPTAYALDFTWKYWMLRVKGGGMSVIREFMLQKDGTWELSNRPLGTASIVWMAPDDRIVFRLEPEPPLLERMTAGAIPIPYDVSVLWIADTGLTQYHDPTREGYLAPFAAAEFVMHPAASDGDNEVSAP